MTFFPKWWVKHSQTHLTVFHCIPLDLCPTAQYNLGLSLFCAMQLFCVGSWLCSLLYLYQQFVFSSIASWWLEDPSGGSEGNEVALCAREMAIQARPGPRGQNQPTGYNWRKAPWSIGMKLSYCGKHGMHGAGRFPPLRRWGVSCLFSLSACLAHSSCSLLFPARCVFAYYLKTWHWNKAKNAFLVIFLKIA